MDSKRGITMEDSNNATANIVDREEWLRARLILLEQEKAFTKARDELSRARQDLPWVR